MTAQKKPGNTGLQGHNKNLTYLNYTELVERTQEFRRKLPELIYELDVPLTVKVDVLERVIDEVPNKQMKLFATNLQAAYIARLAAIRFGGHNEWTN